MLLNGDRLGPYEVLGTLGAGGMGEVYAARDTRLDRTVAIKILAPEDGALGHSHTRFETEARTIASVNHPHICALYDIGRDGNVAYMVPAPLFKTEVVGFCAGGRYDYAPSSDGQRFLVNTRVGAPRPASISVIVGWRG